MMVPYCATSYEMTVRSLTCYKVRVNWIDECWEKHEVFV